ncbi:DUF983 domain-containing protein [Sphingopyxis sp. MWB1]|uniref:DUF983 domain-containing protein n=1 Tax=Sphingopyxis sp. MWB1 TaxID=1537715 RepID=UPI000A6A1161|nr:DUF983 domain-containing protein [Sphingopyxis sp. MWB1]
MPPAAPDPAPPPMAGKETVRPEIVEAVVTEDARAKWRWIFEAGWRGRCPQCGEGRMFRRWLKVADRCEVCGLDYDFAAPDDGPAFFSLCFIAFPLLFLVVWFEVALEPAWWAHLIISAPLMIVPCLLALHPIKGWLVASQYVNKAQEAGTDALWAEMHARAKRAKDAPSGE